jgi:serine/threonine-protein kinase
VAPEIAGRIVVDVLRGLHAAHQLADDHGRPLGLVHRDVSAPNILVGLDGVSKIADFGVAKAVGLMGEATDGPVGKRSYMAPEQLLGETVDRRCDVFSAGVVLWELLTGRRSKQVGERLVLGAAIEHPCAIDPSTDRGLAEIAMRALAREPAERFPSADAMAEAIEEAALQSGLRLSTKRVDAWVSDLVGARVSRQREEARREFEASHFAVRATPPDAETMAEEPRRGRPPRLLLLAAAGLAVVALTVTGVVVVARRPRPAVENVAAPPAIKDVPPAKEEPSGRTGDDLPKLAATKDAPATAKDAPSSAASTPATAASGVGGRRSAGRVAPAAPRAGTPNLPYDNPYRR